MPHKHYRVMLDASALGPAIIDRTMPDPLDRRVRMELPFFSSLYVMTRRDVLMAYGHLAVIEAGRHVANAQACGKAGNYAQCATCRYQDAARNEYAATYCQAALEEAIALDDCPAIDWDEAMDEARDTLGTVYRLSKGELDTLKTAVLTSEERRIVETIG